MVKVLFFIAIIVIIAIILYSCAHPMKYNCDIFEYLTNKYCV